MSDLVRFLSLFAAFFIIAGLLIVFGVFDRCSRSASEAAIAEEIKDMIPAFNLTASQLVQTYRADEESAAAAYNGSVGIVEGPSFLVEESNHLRFYRRQGVGPAVLLIRHEQVERVRDLSQFPRQISCQAAGMKPYESRGPVQDGPLLLLHCRCIPSRERSRASTTGT